MYKYISDWKERFNILFEDLPKLENVEPVRMCALYYLVANCNFLWNYRKVIFDYEKMCFDKKACDDLQQDFRRMYDFIILLNAVDFICTNSVKAIIHGYEIKKLEYKERNVLFKVLQALVLEL